MLHLELIHIDLCDTFPIHSLIRSLYFMILVDDFFIKFSFTSFSILFGVNFILLQNEVENFMGNKFRLFIQI